MVPLISDEPTARLRDLDAGSYPKGCLLMVNDLGRVVPARIEVTRDPRGKISVEAVPHGG